MSMKKSYRIYKIQTNKRVGIWARGKFYLEDGETVLFPVLLICLGFYTLLIPRLNSDEILDFAPRTIYWATHSGLFSETKNVLHVPVIMKIRIIILKTLYDRFHDSIKGLIYT